MHWQKELDSVAPEPSLANANPLRRFSPTLSTEKLKKGLPFGSPFAFLWRREWDSNPQCSSSPHTRFRVGAFDQLSHTAVDSGAVRTSARYGSGVPLAGKHFALLRQRGQ